MSWGTQKLIPSYALWETIFGRQTPKTPGTQMDCIVIFLKLWSLCKGFLLLLLSFQRFLCLSFIQNNIFNSVIMWKPLLPFHHFPYSDFPQTMRHQLIWYQFHKIKQIPFESFLKSTEFMETYIFIHFRQLSPKHIWNLIFWFKKNTSFF